jgi:hypothetical protein
MIRTFITGLLLSVALIGCAQTPTPEQESHYQAIASTVANSEHAETLTPLLRLLQITSEPMIPLLEYDQTHQRHRLRAIVTASSETNEQGKSGFSQLLSGLHQHCSLINGSHRGLYQQGNSLHQVCEDKNKAPLFLSAVYVRKDEQVEFSLLLPLKSDRDYGQFNEAASTKHYLPIYNKLLISNQHTGVKETPLTIRNQRGHSPLTISGANPKRLITLPWSSDLPLIKKGTFRCYVTASETICDQWVDGQVNNANLTISRPCKATLSTQKDAAILLSCGVR